MLFQRFAALKPYAPGLYTILTTGYGVGRKMIMLSGAKEEYFCKEEKCTKQHDIMMVDKIAISVFGGMTSFWLWPWYMYKDLRQLEIYAKGGSLEEYGIRPNKDRLDYMWD